MSDDTARDRLSEEISEAIRSLLTIEGVKGIGKPVTVISPGDLPPSFWDSSSAFARAPSSSTRR
jgi:hypothetical protein